MAILEDSLSTTDYTIAYSALTCALPAFVLHICFAYLSVIAGVLAMLSRVVPFLKPWHAFFGRMFVLVILWCTATSILIFNTGLPRPIMIFLCIMMICITLGWLMIRIHMERMQKQAVAVVETMLREGNVDCKTFSFDKAIAEEKQKILRKRGFWSSLLSIKTFHGLLMVYGWYQMFGRTIVTNPFKWDGCWTYPAYKNADGVAVYVPAEDPDGFSSELAFALGVQLPALALFIVIGIAYCAIVYLKKRREQSKSAAISSSD